MKYKYQIHTHTAPTSKCATSTPRELVKELYNAGYSGCVITNHFYHGNTGVDCELPWEDFVAAYERDYLECKEEGEKYGLDVIFGIEEGVEGYDEILCYGVTPKMLYEHPELSECSIELWHRVMHSEGVLLIQAHPYRSGKKPLPLEYIDGIEVYNGGNLDEANTLAEVFAKVHPDLILTSGGDTHDPENVPFFGILTEDRINDGRELVKVLREGKYRLLTS